MSRMIHPRQRRKIEVMAVPYGRRRFLAGMVVLIFCLSFFCSDAGAVLNIIENGTSNVYGIYDVCDISLAGSEFGWVIANATNNNAYSLFSDGNNITISGEFGSSGVIEAIAGTYHAYGLYSPDGSITTDALNGTINAVAGEWRAVGLFTEDGNITTGDIGGTIIAVAGGSSAFGLRSDYDEGSITTGAISGTIDVLAGGDRAYGFRSYGSIETEDINGTIIATAVQDRAYGLSGDDSITTGAINGTITAIAGQDEAYGLYSEWGSITTGDINGTITATADGSDAYGMYAYGDIIVDGNIGSDAVIYASAGADDAAGLYSANGSITTGDIDGTITATATGVVPGSTYGLYADANLTTGAINGTITAEETSGSGAYALYSGSNMTYGLFSDSGSIYTGDINGVITAFAEADDATGLFSGYAIHTGAINGIITADANTGSDAYGLFANNSDINIAGDIGSDAVITATAGQNWAVGLYSHGSIYTGAINGTITADANTGSYAYGLYSQFDITIDSNIGSDAVISAKAGADDAAGLYSANGSINTGDIDGTITAMATGGDDISDSAYGIYSSGSLTTDAINGTITAEETDGSGAYALYSGSNMTVGDINGTITATAGTDNAYGLYVDDLAFHQLITGDINGTITATAGGSNAAGLYSDGTLITGVIDGTITATATTGSNAFAMYANSALEINYIGDDALITATAGDSNAAGLYSANGSIFTGSIDGTITAETTNGSYAYGLYSGGSSSIHTGGIGGTITADANGSNAYGMYSNGDITIEDYFGYIGGDALISATAGDSNAYGLYSENGSISTGDIYGEISATATNGSNAYGFRSYGTIYTGDIDGMISADANGSYAYALYSNGDITVDGDIGSTANISATVRNGSDAHAIFACSGGSDLTINGDINGTISAEANDSYARALYAYGNININGDIGSSANISATAGLNWAYGLCTNSSININGDVNGIISTEATYGSEAYGIYAFSDIIIDGNIGSDAEITATSKDVEAYSFKSYDTININGDINGVITAEVTDGSGAYGMWSNSDITVGDIGSGALISATAGTNSAYGLYSVGGSITTGAINGTISVEAGSSTAYAVTCPLDLTINGDIGSNAQITATAGTDFAYGLASWNGSLTTGAIDGLISADANATTACAMYSRFDMMIDGDIGSSANISATAGTSSAYGLYSYIGPITTGDIDGQISATAGTSYAYGLYNETGSIHTGDIGSDANISATAGTSWAIGLYSNNGSIETDDIDGNITATAGDSNAAGLYSSNGSISTGDIGGTITAIAGNRYAYGLYAYDSIDTNDITGTITATAGNYRAAGLYSANGSITTGDIDGSITATVMGTEDRSAFGLRSSGVLTTGAINGTITAEETIGSFAYALYSGSDMNITGDIGSDANITATAGDSYAYGLYAGGSIDTCDIDGTISATATNGSNAFAMYSGSNMVIDGDIGSNALITAFAGTDNAAGLFSNGSLTTGDIDGTISATSTAQGGYAYGLYSNGSLTTGAINGIITAEETNGSGAYALYAGSDLTVNGDIGSNARISATANSWTAVGLYSNSGSIYAGDIDGTITATAGNQAYGLRSNNGDIDIDDIGRTAVITATAEGNRAYGLLSTNGSITTDAINGIINATAGGNYAYGLYSTNGGSINTDNIDGDVNATANYNAYGLFSEGSLTTGDIGGTITATVAHETAYGLRSWGDIITGDIDGDITATAGVRKAAALFSEGSLSTGAISGTIEAASDGDYAYGILSYGSMDVTIDGGEVNAVAYGGTHVAAIQSGRIGAAAIGLQTQNADDTLEIVAGSTIIGNIDLAMYGTDDDLLTLSGINTNSTILNNDIMNIETINITGGHWYINGTVFDSLNGITMDGGILSGTGILGSLIINSGTLAPGSSIGTTTIDGDLTLGPNAVYLVDVNNSDQADLVVVTGSADLDGTIRGNALEDINHPFSVIVLDANTGLNGEFATVAGSTAFLFYTVDYNTTDYDVILNVDPLEDFAYYALTGNQSALGNLFNELEGTGGDMDDVIDAIRDLPDGDAVNKAYNQIMPQDALGLPDITRKLMNQFNDNIMNRMDGIRKGTEYAMLRSSDRYLLASADNTTALPPKIDKWTPFVKGFGVWGDRDADTDIAGYKYSVYGTLVGLDNLVSENLLLGLGVGFSKAHVNYSLNGTKSDMDSVLCSLYGSYFKDDWHLDLTASYGHSWYDSRRGIYFGTINRRAKSDHQGDALSAAIEVGKNLGDSTSMILEPIAGLGYTVVQEGGYTEKGADSLNLKVDSDTTDGFYTKLGVRMAKEFRPGKNPDMVIVPKVSIFWIHDFAERVELGSSFIGGGSFKTDGQEPIRDTFNLGAALNIYFTNSLRLFVDYSWQSSGDFNSNMAQVGVRWSF